MNSRQEEKLKELAGELAKDIKTGAEIEFSRYSSARQIAAYVGVTPRKREAGTSLRQTSLSKTGNGRIRKGLYFPAIVAEWVDEFV